MTQRRPRRSRAQPPPEPPRREREQLIFRSVIAEPLLVEEERRRMGLEPDADGRLPVLVELNLRHLTGLRGAEEAFRRLYGAILGAGRPDPLLIADTYMRCDLTEEEVKRLVRADAPELAQRAIHRVWPDFPVQPLVYRSAVTVKADAARRSFAAAGQGVVWGVVDTGIDGRHPHFQAYETLAGGVAGLHRDFTLPPTPDVPTGAEAMAGSVQGALLDEDGHGTHVAGIIAGSVGVLKEGRPDLLGKAIPYLVFEHQMRPGADPQEAGVQDDVVPHGIADGDLLGGVAPRCKLVSLKVQRSGQRTTSSVIIRALEYVRKDLNGNGKVPLVVHGVNISLGYEFDPRWFACGQSPICTEVDRLVRSGVVVVVAAGNTGYGAINLPLAGRSTRTGLSQSINDPGNAAEAITVGSTHRDMPHTYGVSYFSSKGPTGDGRSKPDLVAPGERILSCAAGRQLAGLPGAPAPGAAAYVDDSGTSMAAPHVSGTVAAFLSIRREFVGRPEAVKKLFLETATSLGRERYFEGHGLVDLMRAIQAV